MIDFTNDTNGGGSVSTALLSYQTGQTALTDTTLYNYIKGLYDSGVSMTDTNFTNRGTATIDDLGNATFEETTTGFVQIPLPDLSQASSWEVDIPIKLGNAYVGVGKTESAIIASAFNKTELSITMTSSGILGLDIGNSDGSGWQLNLSGTNALSLNTAYLLKLKYTGEKYQLYVDDTLEIEGNATSSINYTSGLYINIGNFRNKQNDPDGINGIAWQGSICLNGFNIFADGQPVFIGEYIKYRKVKSGSKVADVTYDTIIDNLATAQGYALYYTIDTANKTVTLPRGDIFGFITTALSN